MSYRPHTQIICRNGGYPYRHLMARKNYEKQRYHLQLELLKRQAWVGAKKQKVVTLFEGRDAAGKRGAIKRFMEYLNPRGAWVVALDKSSDDKELTTIGPVDPLLVGRANLGYERGK